jgi:HlyD family secretion protein
MTTHAHSKPARKGFTRAALVAITIVILVIIGFVVWPSGGSGGDEPNRGRLDMVSVQRGGFDITIPTSGELAALNQVEIRNNLETRAQILEIVDEGTRVEAGEVVVRLNDESIRDQVRDSEDSVNTAQASVVSAQSNLDLTKDAHESERKKAELDVELADIALKAWRDGTDKSRRLELDNNIETAQKNRDRLFERYEKSKELVKDEHISLDELKSDEIAFIEADVRLEQAMLAKDVYINYECLQQQKQLESDVEQATDALNRMTQRHATEIANLTTELNSRKFQLESKQERLDKYKAQLEQCVLFAPVGGLVVYASSLDDGRRWGGDDEPPQVGTEVRPNERIMVIPDTSRLVARVKVNEALSGQIEPGQQASVVSDALPGEVIPGEVIGVGVLAESGGWRDPNRRDYTVRILLSNGNDLGLKPSMRCKADIYVGRVDNAMYVPVSAIFRNGPIAFVYMPKGSGYIQREVHVGRSSEMYVEVLDGIDEGDLVLLREPAPERVTEKLDVQMPGNGAAGGNGDRSGPPRGAGEGRNAGGKGSKPRDSAATDESTENAKTT